MSIFRLYTTSSSEPSLYIFEDPEDREENALSDLYSDEDGFEAETHWQTQSEEKFLEILYMLASDETFCMTQASFRNILKTYIAWKCRQTHAMRCA